MTWDVFGILCALIFALVVLFYTNRLARRDPRGNSNEVDSYIEELESQNPISTEQVGAQGIRIHQSSYLVNRPQISGGIWGAIANTQSKYKEGITESLYECTLIVGTSSGLLSSPPLKTSRIALEFLFDELGAIDVLWFSTSEGIKGFIDIRPIVARFGK